LVNGIGLSSRIVDDHCRRRRKRQRERGRERRRGE